MENPGLPHVLATGLDSGGGTQVAASPTIAAMLLRLHHAAIICSDYEVSRRFYTEVLGLPVVGEHWRAERRSWKLDLALPDGSRVELFSFEKAPPRPSHPEARGLRHLAFAVADVAAAKAALEARGVAVEPVRVDEFTGRRFTFLADPDDLPLELYEEGERTRA
jgi:glyoxylase I family protein